MIEESRVLPNSDNCKVDALGVDPETIIPLIYSLLTDCSAAVKSQKPRGSR